MIKYIFLFLSTAEINKGPHHCLRIHSSSLCCIACVYEHCFVTGCVKWCVHKITTFIHAYLSRLQPPFLLSPLLPLPLSFSLLSLSRPMFFPFLPRPTPAPSSFCLLSSRCPWQHPVREKLFMIGNQYPHRDTHALWETQIERERDAELLGENKG